MKVEIIEAGHRNAFPVNLHTSSVISLKVSAEPKTHFAENTFNLPYLEQSTKLWIGGTEHQKRPFKLSSFLNLSLK